MAFKVLPAVLNGSGRLLIGIYVRSLYAISGIAEGIWGHSDNGSTEDLQSSSVGSTPTGSTSFWVQ